VALAGGCPASRMGSVAILLESNVPSLMTWSVGPPRAATPADRSTKERRHPHGTPPCKSYPSRNPGSSEVDAEAEPAPEDALVEIA
jgi:hypothetical protein